MEPDPARESGWQAPDVTADDPLFDFEHNRSLVGIDISSQDTDTAACVIGIRDGKLAVATKARVNDATIGRLLTESTVVAIDAPFAWPSAFTDFAGRWQAKPGSPDLPSWLDRNEDPETAWWKLAEALKFRATDRYVRLYRRTQHHGCAPCTARWPSGFSVAADKMALPAMRSMRLLHSAGITDLTGRGQVAIEVYPGAALAEWHRNPDAYKDTKPAAASARGVIVKWLVDCLGHSGTWELDGGTADKLQGEARASGHILDAFVCAITAWAARVEATARPDEVTLDEYWEAPLRVSKKQKEEVSEAKLRALVGQHDREPVEVVAAEGWIHHPTATPEVFLKKNPWERNQRGLALW